MTPSITTWRKSTRSGPQANCVEVGTATGLVGVRDSKAPSGSVLTVSPRSWTSFLTEVRNGSLDA